jgi:hypothetical protein
MVQAEMSGFRGLLAPGAERLSGEEDLVAIWRTTNRQRFQNYRATFTVLDIPVVPRAWITGLKEGDPLGSECPEAWRIWVASRTYTPLLAPPTVITRSREDQQPPTVDKPLLELVHTYFKNRPYDFEYFAADLWRTSQPNVDRIDVTRPWRDGGRDAVGDYLLGPRSDPVAVEFALEAKCMPLVTESASGRQAVSSPGCGIASSVYSSRRPISTARPTKNFGKTGIQSWLYRAEIWSTC